VPLPRPSYLYSGTLLETAARVGADLMRAAHQAERDFLHVSRCARRRAVHHRRAMTAGGVVLSLALFTAAGLALLNVANANKQCEVY
jgi:hypothetical protein